MSSFRKNSFIKSWLTATLVLSAVTAPVHADVFKLKPILVEEANTHSSQETRTVTEDAFAGTRSSTSTNNSMLLNLNPVNTGDTLRFTTPGLINSPGVGSRFGGPSSIRTFGDWGAATSIDGLPAVKFTGDDDAGYTNSRIPTIAIDEIEVLKGGRGVQYGNGTDGGVFETHIKSGRGYDDHAGITVDISNAGEKITQAEVADSTDTWDLYLAGSYMRGDYNGTDAPEEIDMQNIGSFAGKTGFNLSEDTRIEVLGLYSKTHTDQFRNDAINDIHKRTKFYSTALDHRISQNSSLRAGFLNSDSNFLWEARDRDRSTNIDTYFADYYKTHRLSDTVEYAGSLGAEYKITNYLRDKDAPDPLNQWDNTFDDYALKSINTFTFNNNFTATAGLRNTWFNNDVKRGGVSQPDNLESDSVVSWELGGAYSVLEMTRIRASAATGYNRFYEKYGNFGSDALNPAGAEDEIVESMSYEIGVNQGWGNGYLDIALYQIEQENVPRRESGAIESVTVEQQGIEMEVFSSLTDRLTATAGYTHIFNVKVTRADGSDSDGNIFFGTNGVNIPQHLITLRVDYQISDAWTAWGAGLHGEGYEQDNADGLSNTRRPYNRVDVGAAWWATEQLTFRVRAENITDEKDFGQTLEGDTVDTDGKLGRVFWFGLDYTL